VQREHLDAWMAWTAAHTRTCHCWLYTERTLSLVGGGERQHSWCDTRLPSSVRFFVSTEVRRARLIFHDRSQRSMRSSRWSRGEPDVIAIRAGSASCSVVPPSASAACSCVGSSSLLTEQEGCPQGRAQWRRHRPAGRDGQGLHRAWWDHGRPAHRACAPGTHR
jgi:hypothetical protein